MKALVLHQPWASLVALGEKRIETRPRNLRYRGQVAICAGKSPDHLILCRRDPFHTSLFAHYQKLGLTTTALIETIPLGMVLAVVNIWQTCPVEQMGASDFRYAPDDKERAYGDYTPGRWAWYLKDVVRLTNWVPVRGMQGLFDLPRAVEFEVRRQIE